MTRFSVEMEVGRLSSFVGVTPNCIDCCGFACFGGQIVDKEPIPSKFFSMKSNFHLNQNNQFGVGFSISQQGYREFSYFPLNSSYYRHDKKADFFGIILCHEMALLHGNNISFGIGNELQFDFHQNHFQYSIVNKHGLSHLGNLILIWDISKHFGLKLKSTIRAAVTQYGDVYYGKFHRFGYGLLLGVDYRFGKLKYYSLQIH